MVRLWIIGHSFIHLATEYAINYGFYKDLGFHQLDITWIGHRGMKWHQILRIVVSINDCEYPDLMIVHFGGNDLGII